MKRKNGRMLLKRILCVMLCFTFVFGACTFTSDAATSKKAMKFLKGKWYSNSQTGKGASFYVVFTKKYEKYYYIDYETGKYHYSGKSKIVSAKKTKHGYLVKVKNSKGKYCYESEGEDTLNCFSTWDRKKFSSSYSGSSSLTRNS